MPLLRHGDFLKEKGLITSLPKRGQTCSPKHVHLFLRNTSWRKKHVFVFCKTRKILHFGEVQKLRQDVEILLNSKTADTIWKYKLQTLKLPKKKL